ncbi:MAG: DEAD/DEAH box helicase [Spirochaetaceae bacterium]
MENIEQLISELRSESDFSRNVTRFHTVPAREARFSPVPEDIPGVLREVLRRGGIDKLYSHQARSYELVREGRNLVLVTPTASGKTLAYNLPVVRTLLEEPEMRALYLFPTKALSQDQQAGLNEIVSGAELPIKVSTYDGDTPGSLRVSAREGGRIVISNPDMLHSGILPNHPKWIKFLSNLRYVVIDEMHSYRGIFGSHMTNLLRRLKRIAAFYGTEPQFICCSATIGNPHQLAERILEAPVELVEENGAPSGEKHIIFYNPPIVDPVQGIRRGVVLESRRIASRLIKKGIKTIVFARSRIRSELIADYIRKELSNYYTDDGGFRIESYRGGYLPNERRGIEKGLREGKIHGVVSTIALELGIDIGELDAAVLAGFPSSISSVWQQSGRAGRRVKTSAAFLVASASPTDQFLINHPDYFFAQSPESAWINPDNLFVLIDHLKCAVFEIPMSEGEIFGGVVEELLEYLEEEGNIRKSRGKWYWADRGYPAESISLRSASPENVVIIDAGKGKNEVIGEMDLPSAKELLFPNAVYLHRGTQYLSLSLDVDELVCYVREEKLNYYTDSIVKSDIKLLQVDEEREEPEAHIFLSDVLVRSQVSKYKKLKYGTHENLGYGDIHLPEEEIHTRAAVIVCAEATASRRAFEEVPLEIREDILSRVGTLIRNVAPIFLLCERSDIGIVERLRDQYTGAPAIYLYDNAPGGIGLAEGFIEKLEEVLGSAFELVRRCPCREGCPSCVGPDESTDGENRKERVVEFLARWMGYGEREGAEQADRADEE